MVKNKILVVDDEVDLCEILQFNLEAEGYEVDTVISGEDALKKKLSRYDLFILDVMMGGMSGFKLAGIIRQNKDLEDVPILFLSAKDTENDKLTGFTLGADDYISKPFSIRELCARVKVALNRTKKKKETEKKHLSFYSLELQADQKKLILDGQKIELTKKEFEILHLLLSYPNKVFSREELLSKIWTSNDVYVLDRTIDVNITRIRKKIGKYGKNIITKLGYGYMFDTQL